MWKVTLVLKKTLMLVCFAVEDVAVGGGINKGTRVRSTGLGSSSSSSSSSGGSSSSSGSSVSSGSNGDLVASITITIPKP